MPRILLDKSPEKTQHIHPDEDGFTIETEFHGEQQLVDEIAQQRSVDPKPRHYTKAGVCYRHVGRIPMSLIHKFCMKHDRWPQPDELLDMLRSRDLSKLRATEEKF